MKRAITICAIGMLILTCAPALKAQQQGPSANFYLNFGIMTDDSFKFDPIFWYFGGNLDIHLGDYIMISPETNLVTYKFNFEAFFLEHGGGKRCFNKGWCDGIDIDVVLRPLNGQNPGQLVDRTFAGAVCRPLQQAHTACL